MGHKILNISVRLAHMNPAAGFPLTCELCQDLFDGHAAGVRVSMGAVRRDQVIRGGDGRLDACSTRFLWAQTNLITGM